MILILLCYHNSMKKLKVNKGEKYNRLSAIREVIKTHKQHRRYLWKCDCGIEKEIDLIAVKRGNTKSCGCLLKEHVENQPKGESSPTWKGGRRIEDGYVLVYKPKHVNCKSNGYVREHAFVMSQFLRRPLEKGENVHHVNGDKSDNRIENLELWSTSQPSGQRIEDKVKWAEEIISKYKHICRS